MKLEGRHSCLDSAHHNHMRRRRSASRHNTAQQKPTAGNQLLSNIAPLWPGGGAPSFNSISTGIPSRMSNARAPYRATTAATTKPDDPTRAQQPSRWRKGLAPFARPDASRAVTQLLNTALPFLAIMALMVYWLDSGAWAAVLLAIPASGLLVRLFIIQHDCGHASFFKSRRLNNLLGRALGVLTFTPYAYWRRSHATHHASAGNLDRRGVGDVTTLTVREYLKSSTWERFAYRLYRHPLTLFGIGPVYQFLIRHRIPGGHPIREW